MRQTARKCRILHLKNGNYIQQEGWNPNYVETELGNISRVNIMAVVVSSENNVLTVDDGTGTMELRSFDTPLTFEIGDRVLIIARPRVYNDQMYLASEIVKKLPDDGWLEYRKLELELTPKIKTVEKIIPVVESTVIKEASKQLKTADEILETIRKLDSGDGANIDEVATTPEIERIINLLMEEGEIFETKPGKLKVLD